MITDRISLNLAHLYLVKFQAIEGPISNILFRKTLYDYPGTKLESSFNNLTDFKNWIDENAPLSMFADIECLPLALYELISFNVTKNINGSNTITQSDKNVVANDNRVFKTNSENINAAGLLLFNDSNESYVKTFKDLLHTFNQLKLDEYIIIQKDYIDCGYIQTYFGKYVDDLLVLYKKYKNRKQ